ncbi:MAG: NAD(P)H-binding protein [Myxococcales bacterium]|nr:NAD(P)H-binding protein [Myxococcales bacterium]
MSKIAALFGATGLVGGHLLSLLAKDERWSRVVCVVRRAGAVEPSERVVVSVSDTLALDAERVDDVFIALGTTIKKAGSRAAFRAVDEGAVVGAARAGRERGATGVFLVSALGADARSLVFYNKTKGEAEDAVRALGYERCVIARPSFLDGDRAESRPGERVGIAVTKALSFALVGGLAKYRAIAAADVARVLVNEAKDGSARAVAIESDDLAARARALG